MGVPRGRIEGIKENKFKNKGTKKSPNSPLDRFRLLKDLELRFSDFINFNDYYRNNQLWLPLFIVQ